jgi:hypothetical protein
VPFAVSIGILGLVQAALVALPAPRVAPRWLVDLGGRWWALIPALSIVVVIAVIELDSDSATWLSYLALVAVPPLAAFALGVLLRGSRPAWALAAVALFALAWATPTSLVGETAATALSGLACIALGWLLVSAVPAYWLRLGIYAMAAIDTYFVASDLLQSPNAALNLAAPGGGLPRLQAVHFGSAQMGFGDLFIAALLGCLLARDRSRQLKAAILVAALALAFDLLFFAFDELPATVPVAAALALLRFAERDRRPGRVSSSSDSGT